MEKRVSRDTEGYLLDPEDWSIGVANLLADEENIQLSEIHWMMIDFIRKYYDETHISPDVRHLIKYLAIELGCKKEDAKKSIFSAFPYGYVKQACKIAGMRKPRAWSTG